MKYKIYYPAVIIEANDEDEALELYCNKEFVHLQINVEEVDENEEYTYNQPIIRGK